MATTVKSVTASAAAAKQASRQLAVASTKAKDAARKFLDFLESPEARPTFEAQGFTILAGRS